MRKRARNSSSSDASGIDSQHPWILQGTVKGGPLIAGRQSATTDATTIMPEEEDGVAGMKARVIQCLRVATLR